MTRRILQPREHSEQPCWLLLLLPKLVWREVSQAGVRPDLVEVLPPALDGAMASGLFRYRSLPVGAG
jgi:hypothetical protein